MRRMIGAPAMPQSRPAMTACEPVSVSQPVSAGDIAVADALVADLKADLLRLSRGDPRAFFALRRRALARLKQADDSALSRRKLQVTKYAEQGGTCAVCGLSLPRAAALLHRRDPQAGFTVENTRLVHGSCQVVSDGDQSVAPHR